jgi:pimeloyl-ACP methyl ester carboxylesterase
VNLLFERLAKSGVKLDAFTSQVFAQSWKQPGALADADIAVAVIEPGDYGAKYSFIVEPPDDENPTGKLNIQFNFNKLKAPLPCKGTVVVLHGFGESKESMIFWGIALAERGYRVVLVDLRGHGESGGKRIHFGASESSDLVKVMDELQRRRLAGRRVGLLGVSYGGAVGVLWAAKDPRVQAIVLIEPYADPRRAIPDFIRGVSENEKQFSDADFAWAEERGAKLAGFSWEETIPVDHIADLKSPVLVFHGEGDTWVPLRNSEELCARAAPGSKLVRVAALFPKGQHVFLPLRVDFLAPEVAAWFDTRLADSSRPVPSEN